MSNLAEKRIRVNNLIITNNNNINLAHETENCSKRKRKLLFKNDKQLYCKLKKTGPDLNFIWRNSNYNMYKFSHKFKFNIGILFF